jgi:hypothetical protein
MADGVSLCRGCHSRARPAESEGGILMSRLGTTTALVAVLLAIASGCGGDGGDTSATDAPQCQRSTGQHSVGRGAERIANPIGPGPVYVSLGMEAPPPSPLGFVSLRDDRVRNGRYYHKSLWAVVPHYRYPVEVRGRMTGGSRSLLLFQTGREQLRLSPVLRIPASRGWRATPTTTVLPGAGCFAFNVSGHELMERIVFEARR